jgi:signal peptidase I
MKKLLFVVILFLIQYGFSQTDGEKLFRGQLVNDSIKVENIIIFNLNSRVGTMSKTEGFFDVYALPGDTISFSSIQFKTKKILLSNSVFDERVYAVRLQQYINQLDEVVISNKKITQVSENTQKYVDKQYFDDAQSSPKTTNVYDGKTPGVDAVRLFKDILKLFKKKNPKVIEPSFTETTLNRVKYSYFRDTLKLKDNEIALFLLFCETDHKAKIISKSENLLNLMDFLYNRNKEFKEIRKGI